MVKFCVYLLICVMINVQEAYGLRMRMCNDIHCVSRMMSHDRSISSLSDLSWEDGGE